MASANPAAAPAPCMTLPWISVSAALGEWTTGIVDQPRPQVMMTTLTSVRVARHPEFDRVVLVLPERPAGTESMSEEELAVLVTRDAMVGVRKVVAP